MKCIRNLLILNKYTFGIVCVLLMIFITGCSRKKDKFINRNWHAVTTEYNTLYNGNLALEQGKEQIAQSYEENFWQILPVERMQVSEEIRAPGTERNEDFRLAEEKATKAIQRHSMLIQGKEKNPQVDEAYLLLGKARYYDQRFIPALEAFNYILHKYPSSNTISHAQIWREKTNMRLENDGLAIKNLKRLIESGRLEKQDKADAHAFLAQAYINTGSADSAVAPIKVAAVQTRDNEEKGRYHYLEGQLYNILQKRDSANLAFDKVIDLNRRTPREYFVNAQLEKVRNFDFSGGNHSDLLIKLREMEEDRENRPFLDRIYFQIAEYYNHLDSTEIAIENYNISLSTPTSDNFLGSVIYETLADIYFNNSQYRTAGTYFDSTLTRIPQTSRDYFVIKRKRDNLQEVILYEELIEKNDSILNLVSMNETERLDFFTQFTGMLQAKAVEEAKTGGVAESPEPQATARRNPGAPPALGGPNMSNNFYFYNPTRVANGMQEFLQLWGPRELKDNWRTDAGNTSGGGDRQLDEVSELIIANNPRFNPETYLERIPQDPVVIDSIAALRNNAYYRLGLIYKEKFRENSLAADKLRDLLTFTDEERLVLPASYYLYQIYLEEGNQSEAEKYKEIVLRDHPDSRFAANIRNPGQVVELEDTAENSYERLYELFENEEYGKVIELGKAYTVKFSDEELLPKIELLTATATGRLLGYEAYKQALKNVALNYPQTEEGEKAQQLLDKTMPVLAEKDFNKEETSSRIKMLYMFPAGGREEAQKLKDTIDEALEEVRYTKYHTSIDIYDPHTIFVMVHGMESIDRAEGFAELLQVNESYSITMEPVIISSENYRVVQLHKNLDIYLEQQNNP